MRNSTKGLFLLLLPFMLSACGIKLSGAKRIENTTIETFLVENGIIQYFVKPLHYRAPHAGINIDFTFRGGKDTNFKAKMNFTLTGKESSKIDSCKIVTEQTNAMVLTVKQFEIIGTRFFSEVDNQKLYHFFSEGKPFVFITYTNGIETTYHASKKAVKKIKRIPKVLLSN